MAEGCKYFCEDAVYRSCDGIVQYGVITENAEYISSDDDEELEVERSLGYQRIRKGEVRVSWHPSGHEEVVSDHKLKLADRSLMPGDVVRRLDNKKAAQCGYCTMTCIKADIEVLGSNSVLCSIPSEDLTSLTEFEEDVAVVLDSWIGVVDKVNTEVTLKTADGSRCVMSYDDVLDLTDVQSNERSSTSVYTKENIHPKQLLSGPAVLFQRAKWISKASDVSNWKSKRDKTVRVTVEKLKTTSLNVHWQDMGFSPSNNDYAERKIPPTKVEGEDLKRVKMLKLLDCCSLQIGDKKMYTFPEDVQLVSKWEWLQRKSTELFKTKYDSVSDSNLQIGLNNCDIDENRKNESTNDTNIAENDVAHSSAHHKSDEDDSSSEYEDFDEDDKVALSESSSLSNHSAAVGVGHKHKGARTKKSPSLATKLLKQKKLKKVQKKEAFVTTITPKSGDLVVVEVLSTETVVDVMWQNGTIETEIAAAELYPVNNVDDHEYFPGDFVVEHKDGVLELIPNQYGVIQSVNYAARIAQVNWMRPQRQGSSSELVPQVISDEEVSVYDLRDHPDFNYRPQTVVVRITDLHPDPRIIGDELSPGGQVVSLSCSGKIEVQWADGKRSLCYPQELNRVGDYDSDDSLFGDTYESTTDSDDSWETESEESIDTSGDEASALMVHKKKLAKWFQETIKHSSTLTKFLKSPLHTITKNSMKPVFEVYKKLRVIDSMLGSTHFDDEELKLLFKQLQEKNQNKKFESKLEKLTEMFGVPSESVSELVQNLDMLKLTWEEDAKRRLKLVSEENGDSDALTDVNDSNHLSTPKSDSKQEASASASSSSSKNKPNSKREIFLKFIFKIRTGILALCKELKQKAEEQDIQNTDFFENFVNSGCDENVFKLMDNHCRELDEAAQSVCSPTNNSLDLTNNSFVDPEISCEKVNDSIMINPENEKMFENSSVTNDEEKEPNTFTGFSMLESVTESHKFKSSFVQPIDPKTYFKAIKKELSLLQNGVPDGIFIKGYEDRMDLFSIMIKGPTRTPYEDGLFLFDLQLPADYPSIPPLCHFISFCSDRLNPNLYEDGKVCVSLLGTWGGKGTEVWTSDSNLLQLIISIQGLILVPEPYYNEPGTEVQKNTSQGKENSRLYNEMAVLKLTQSMTKLLSNVPVNFAEEIQDHYKTNIPRLINRFEKWLAMSESWNHDHPESPTSPTVYREAHSDAVPNSDDFYLPEYPLLPASRGFCLSLRKALNNLKDSRKCKEN